MKPICLLSSLLALAAGCSMTDKQAADTARGVLDQYSKAFEAHDPRGLNELMALSDPRFGAYSEVSPALLDAMQVQLNHLNVRNLESPKMRFEDLRAWPLENGLILVTATQHGSVGAGVSAATFTNRATFVMARRGASWKVIHEHLSPAQEDDQSAMAESFSPDAPAIAGSAGSEKAN